MSGSRNGLYPLIALLAFGASWPAHAEQPVEDEIGPETPQPADVGDEAEKAEADVDGTEPERPTTPSTKTSTPIGSTGALRFRGYLQPQFRLLYRPEARSEDKWTYGVADGQVGLIVDGQVLDRWTYIVHVVLSANLFTTTDEVMLIDTDGDGTPDSVDSTTRPIAGLRLEETSIAYDPAPWLRLKLGQMRIPFTVQHQSQNYSLLFSGRSGPNEAFLSGTDGGFLAVAGNQKSKVRGSLGIFGGSEVPGFVEQTRESGPLLSARLDWAPLGAFPVNEGVLSRGPFRLGVGAGVLFHPAVTFDNDGFVDSEISDVRFAGSVRASGAGLSLQAELLGRQRTDNISSRSIVDIGGYAQAAALLAKSEDVSVAPIVRFGWVEENREIDPRTTVFVEAGLALYLHVIESDPQALKIILQYLGEFRRTENEDAHGGVTQIVSFASDRTRD